MSKPSFWDVTKSATLSIVVTWVGLVLAALSIPFLVPILKRARIPGTAFDDSFVVRAVGPLYACLAFGIAALIILLLTLLDIRRGEVFTAANVRRLRLISYCGFGIMLACAVGAVVTVPRLIFVFLVLVAGFLSLLMRTIKNVIDTARMLKEEADYTI
ncbi:MAG: DUF2975 domain-containing protein [Propionibacteriaceae bacterium]|nr:DUF2975 domain-containing protein [Propionibacteriaceae bacterium]